MSAATPNVSGVFDVAGVSDVCYTGGMPRKRHPDELTATQAIELLGTYRQHFYDLIHDGLVKQHFRKTAQKRPYYLRSELLELKRQLDEEESSTR